MTGEMSYINPETGVDSNGESWPIHLAIAKELNGELKPFDSYQGPYITIGGDFVVSPSSDYRIPIQGFGIIRLWIFWENEFEMKICREDTEKSVSVLCINDPEIDQQYAVIAAKELVT